MNQKWQRKSYREYNMKNVLSFTLLALIILGSGYLLAEVTVSGQPVATISKESLFDTFASGGWVMWPILFCSLAGIAYGVERFFNLRSTQVLPKNFMDRYDEVFQKVKAGNADADTLKALITEGRTDGERLFSKFLRREYVNVRDFEQVLQEYVDIAQWKLQKNIKPIGLISQICPLLGLFGTVLGMIKAFDVVAQQGLGKPEVLANGMAVALLTTGFGLGVAIPCSWLHHHLIEKSNKVSLWLYNLLHELILEWCRHASEIKK